MVYLNKVTEGAGESPCPVRWQDLVGTFVTRLESESPFACLKPCHVADATAG